MPGTFDKMNHPVTVDTSRPSRMAAPASTTVTSQQARHLMEQQETQRLSDQQIARLGGPRVWEAMNAYADETWSQAKRDAWDNIARNGTAQDKQRALDDFKRDFFDARLKREPTGQAGPGRMAR